MKNREFKDAAYTAYDKALRAGLLVPSDRCERCGEIADVDGHHTDYSRPFDVEWLCRKCHNGIHREFTAARRLAGIDIPKPTALPRSICHQCAGTGRVATPLPLTRSQRDLYEFIWHYVKANGYAPSFEEIAATYGYASLATVHEHVQNLELKHWLARRFNEARSILCLVDLGQEAKQNVA